jgi:integrase
MSAPYHPIQTAADVMAMVEQSEMPERRKQDMLSAIRRVCDMIGCVPAARKLEVPALRALLAAIRPAAHGISRQTYANARSLFAAAMELAGVIERFPRGAARTAPEWAPLTAAIAKDKRLANGLAAFMNWCAWTGVEPASVDDGILQRFLVWMETRTLYARARNLVRQIPAIWSDARALVPGWPAAELARISFRPVSPNLRWEELPEGLRVDAEGYLKSRAEPDLFSRDPDAPTRPLEPSTVRLQQEHIRIAASVLLRHGASAADLDGLAALVAVDAVRTVLRHYHAQAAGKPNAFAVGIARTLIHIARYSVKVPEDCLAELKKLARLLPAIPFDLTAKNKALLAELENEVVRARLLCLSDALMRDVSVSLQAGRRLKFVEAQVAVAIDILLLAPLRPQNLIELNFSRNFKEPEGPRGKLLIYVPKDATKTKRRDLTFEIPPELAGTIRRYRREILPRLGGDPNGDLFVSEGGGRKSQDTLSDQIIDRIERMVGIHMTPHQFRHLAAALYLETHPEDFQTVSDLLGHSFAKTTLVYAGSSSRRASRAYGKLVIEQRDAAALKQRRSRRRPK